MNVIHFQSAVARIKNREKYKRIAAKLTRRCPELKCELPPGYSCELCRGCVKGA